MSNFDENLNTIRANLSRNLATLNDNLAMAESRAERADVDKYEYEEGKKAEKEDEEEKKFAEKVGKLPSEVTKWLSGTHNFTVDTLCEIATVLDVNLYELIETNDSVALLAINNMRDSFLKQLASLEESLRHKNKKD